MLFFSSNKWLGFSKCCDVIPSPPLSAAGSAALGYWLRELRSAGLQLQKKRAPAGTRRGQLCFSRFPSLSVCFANFAHVAVVQWGKQRGGVCALL